MVSKKLILEVLVVPLARKNFYLMLDKCFKLERDASSY